MMTVPKRMKRAEKIRDRMGIISLLENQHPHLRDTRKKHAYVYDMMNVAEPRRLRALLIPFCQQQVRSYQLE